MRATSFDLDYRTPAWTGPRRARPAGERAALGMGLAACFCLFVAARTAGGLPPESGHKLALVHLTPVAAASGPAAFDEAVVASHVGRAVAAIGEVTGREVGTDILDRIFSRHCIGK